MAFHLAFALACLGTVASDLLLRRVFNGWLLLALAVKAAAMSFFPASLDGIYPSGWGASLAGLAAGLFFFVPLYVFRAMGAGDVKFLALLGFWLGLPGLLPAWLGGSVLAGIHAVVYAMRRQEAAWFAPVGAAQAAAERFAPVRRANEWIVARRGGRSGIPYAAYLAMAALAYVYWQ